MLTWCVVDVVVVVMAYRGRGRGVGVDVAWRGSTWRGVAGTSLLGPGGARLGDMAVVLDG